MTVFPIHKRKRLTYDVAIILFISAQAIGSPSMALESPGGTARTRAIGHATDGDLARRSDGNDQSDRSNLADYSYGSPAFRKSLKHLASNQTDTAPAADKAAPGPDKPVVTPAAATVPTATPEQMERQVKTIDPCTKLVVDTIPPPGDRPKALESVKDRDPELYRQIQAKVTDPRYTGELGSVTVSTHDKKGRVNGCTFIQNVPYWESGPAAQSLVDVNIELAKKGKSLEADPLNGAGRTLGQEEAIVWRNSGVHAKVGKSNHGYGRAIDFKMDEDPKATKQPYDDPFVNQTLHAHGWRQGDTWGPLKNDLHHWSYVGPGPATDGPPPSKQKHKHHR